MNCCPHCTTDCSGQHASGLHQCYIMRCCCSSPGHSAAHAQTSPCCSAGETAPQCERDHRQGHTSSHTQGQPRTRECREQQPVTDADMETSQSLWTGVSGVPGLGVSIPRGHVRPVSSLDEWDRHDLHGHGRTIGNAAGHRQVGSRCTGSVSLVSLPRLGSSSQRSSSCRSSSRSSVTSNQSSSQYSNR